MSVLQFLRSCDRCSLRTAWVFHLQSRHCSLSTFLSWSWKEGRFPVGGPNENFEETWRTRNHANVCTDCLTTAKLKLLEDTLYSPRDYRIFLAQMKCWLFSNERSFRRLWIVRKCGRCYLITFDQNQEYTQDNAPAHRAKVCVCPPRVRNYLSRKFRIWTLVVFQLDDLLGLWPMNVLQSLRKCGLKITFVRLVLCC